jgi:nucleotide-binding universal stress UspA family protein
MTAQPIVVGVDGSEPSVRAAAVAWRIAQAARAEWRPVHALPDIWAAASFAQVPISAPELARRLEAEARARLEAALGGVVPRRALGRLELRVGPAPWVVATAAREWKAALVAVGGKRHGALARALGGSTAHYLVRTLDCPVLVVAPTTTAIERILAALDLSEAAADTLAAARWLAGLLGAQLRAVHVVEPIRFPVVVPLTIDEGEFYERSVRAFERLAGSVEHVVRRGVADEAIAAEAAEWRAEVIVVGSHGKGWVDRVLVGSTTERLLNALAASLLVVPPSGARTRRVARKGRGRRESR